MQSREIDGKAVRRALQRIAKYEKESRYLVKRSEEFEVLEEVFDKPTLLTLYDLMNSGVFKYLNGVVSSGKEARVYWGVTERGDVAVKIYLVVASGFRKRLPYILGDPRFKAVKRGARDLVELWARKEYRNLLAAKEADIDVPKPYAVKGNVLVMDFIGNHGEPAPLLRQVEVDQGDYLRVVQMIEDLYTEAKLAHADLSEFNFFKHGNRLVMFDFGSAVDTNHPMARDFLRRDIANMNRFFAKRGIVVRPTLEILSGLTGG